MSNTLNDLRRYFTGAHSLRIGVEKEGKAVFLHETLTVIAKKCESPRVKQAWARLLAEESQKWPKAS